MERPIQRILRIIIDGICLFLICIPTIVFKFGNIEPFHRGFYCNDESITKPYKPSSVHWNDAIITAVLLNTLMIVLIEFLRYLTEPNKDLLPRYTIGSVHFNDFFVKTYKYLGLFYFGFGFAMSFMDIGKYTIGRLRPHFLTVCLPDQASWDRLNTEVNCTGPIAGTWRYIEEDVCTGDKEKIRQARQSFPSGHSILSWYSMLYLAIYLQARMTWNFSILFRHFLQACLLWMAFYSSLSRIADYKHHAGDILAGTAIGILIVIFTIHWIPGLFGLPDRQGDDAGANDGNRKISSTVVHVPAKKISRASREGFDSQHTSEPVTHCELEEI